MIILTRAALVATVVSGVFWTLSMAMKGGSGGLEVLAQVLIILAVVLSACVVVPRKVASALPAFLFRSKFINTVILALLLLGWLFAIGVLVWLFGVEGEATARALSRDVTGYGRGASIVIGAIYLLGLGSASLLVAAWAWLGLRSGIDGACRKLNVSQMLVATPGLLIGFAALYLMSSHG